MVTQLCWNCGQIRKRWMFGGGGRGRGRVRAGRVGARRRYIFGENTKRGKGGDFEDLTLTLNIVLG